MMRLSLSIYCQSVDDGLMMGGQKILTYHPALLVTEIYDGGYLTF